MRKSQARRVRSAGVASLGEFREAKQARQRAVKAEIRNEIQNRWADEVGRVIAEKGEWLGLDQKGRTVRVTRDASGFVMERMP